jgi:hypothetical protein
MTDRLHMFSEQSVTAYHPWLNNNLVYARVQTTHPSVPRHNNLPQVPLHAPVPLLGRPPHLSCSSLGISDRHHSPTTRNFRSIKDSTTPLQSTSETVSHLNAQFPQHQEIVDFFSAASEQKFLTPSELLSQLAGKPQYTGPINEPERKFESQRKARQRAVAQSIGFEPTDPYVPSFSFPTQFKD